MSNKPKIPAKANEQNIYPEKPETPYGFKKAVAWFGGRELIASLKGMIMYAIFGENIDARTWMNANQYPNIVETVINQKKIEEQKKLEKVYKKAESRGKTETSADSESPDLMMLNSAISARASQNIKEKKETQTAVSTEVEKDWAKKISDQWNWKKTYYDFWDECSKNEKFWAVLQPSDGNINEFWFDYIADSGDGQLGVYGVACMCLSDLWLENDENSQKQKQPTVKFQPPEISELDKKTLLPRGVFLFVGGDTAYHSSNYATLMERFQFPFRWAFSSVREFAEKNYRLKPEKKPDKNKPASATTSSPEDGEQSAAKLPGALPGKDQEIEYFDTEPTRPLFGIPANHDYYDGIDGFNRQFRKPPFENIEENMVLQGQRGKFLLQIPTFSRKQEASYIAIRLPFDWWFFGIDSENEKLDFRQELYFRHIVEQKPKKLIMATPEPTTVFGKRSAPDAKTAVYLKTITEDLGLSQPFLTDGKLEKIETKKTDPAKPDDPNAKYCRLDLSGDVHHYARYWGEDTRNFEKETKRFSSENYASLVSGGGGAFFDVTKTMIGKPLDENEQPLKDKSVRGEIPPQKIFPSIDDSLSKTADKIFDLWNIRLGGYVQHAGAVIAIILFYFLTYFSNISKFFNPSTRIEFGKITSLIGNDLFNCLALLLASGILTFISAKMLSALIQKLKDKSFKNELNEHWDARILQYSICYIPLVCGLILYFLALGSFYDFREQIAQNVSKTPVEYFLISCNLLVSFLIFILMIWLSFEHSNWLAVRFKIVRKYKIKTVTQKLDDPNEDDNFFYFVFGKFFRLYSYQYFLSYALVTIAFVVLITGLNLFGSVSIVKSLADSLVIVVVIGLIVLLVYLLAYDTGATYHTSKYYKFWFIVIGIWHYVLQIAAPLILFFYGSWFYLLINFLLIGFFNGSGLLTFLIRRFLVSEDHKSFWDKIADFRIAATLTKYLSKYLLFLVWFVYGAALITVPFFLKLDSKDTIYGSIKEFIGNHYQQFPGFHWLQDKLPGFYNILAEDFAAQFNSYLIIWVSILVVGYIGFLMSRVWLSWYLAVSMLFDGHNNEAGGAARIEGFKHILRIKVEKVFEDGEETDKLTVYVIGFDEPKSDIKKLHLKLVDKFSLVGKPVN